MTVPTNTLQTYSAVGNKEDIEDILYNDDPEDTPFITSIDRDSAIQKLHQWQTIGLDTPSTSNAVIEGDDVAADSPRTSTLLSNTCQLMDKAASVSSSQQASSHYGRDDELALQTVIATKSLRRDMECTVLSNTAENTGAATVARALGAIHAWLTSNVSRDSTSGASGGLGNTAQTDSSVQRDLTEKLIRDVLISCFQNGGDPDTIMLGPSHASQFSGLVQGNSTRYIMATAQEVNAAVDVYKSQFGPMKIVPNRFMKGNTIAGGAGIRDALILQTNRWAAAYLQPVSMEKLAKTGHADRNMVSVEFTLVSRNEKCSGVVSDLNF